MVEWQQGDKLTHGPPNMWDVSAVDNMNRLCHRDDLMDFNEPIGKWDVSGVKDFEYAFYNTKKFDQILGSCKTFFYFFILDNLRNRFLLTPLLFFLFVSLFPFLAYTSTRFPHSQGT